MIERQLHDRQEGQNRLLELLDQKTEEMRRRQAESLSPKKNRRSAFSSQRDSESRETRNTIRAVKRVYSCERARHIINMMTLRIHMPAVRDPEMRMSRNMVPYLERFRMS
jgi:KaiC/GvpD/RAD55 family RecA-like ATPase